VTLPQKKAIKAIKITNRADCCPERLSGFNLYVDGERCATNVEIGAGVTKTVPCVATGSVVMVQLPRESTLTICEFDIKAAPAKDSNCGPENDRYLALYRSAPGVPAGLASPPPPPPPPPRPSKVDSCASQAPYTVWNDQSANSAHGNACFKPGGKPGGGDWQCPDKCKKQFTAPWCVGTADNKICRTPKQLEYCSTHDATPSLPAECRERERQRNERRKRLGKALSKPFVNAGKWWRSRTSVRRRALSADQLRVKGALLVRENVECGDNRNEHYMGQKATLQECADACKVDGRCRLYRTFIYGIAGSKIGKCWSEGVSSGIGGCSKFIPKAYNYYHLA